MKTNQKFQLHNRKKHWAINRFSFFCRSVCVNIYSATQTHNHLDLASFRYFFSLYSFGSFFLHCAWLLFSLRVHFTVLIVLQINFEACTKRKTHSLFFRCFFFSGDPFVLINAPDSFGYRPSFEMCMKKKNHSQYLCCIVAINKRRIFYLCWPLRSSSNIFGIS